MRRRLFAPLRMNATTASQPPEGALAAQRASGYAWDGSAQRPLLFRYTQSRPGGAVSTTAADMGRFMLMLLGDGSLDGARALSPASRAAMLQPQFRSHPRLPGVTYAFRQWETRGRLLLHHDGTLGDQVAVMLLDPANAFGLFVASNANPGIGNHLLDPLLTHLFGPAPPVPPPAPVRPATGNAQRVAGAYRDYHRTRHDLSRIRALMPMLQSRVAPDGDAITWGGRRWVEVEPMVFQTTGSGDRLVFGPGLMQTWTTSYERIGWTEQSWFHITVVLTCLLVFVGYVAWHARTRRRLAEARAARFCALFVAVANVTFLVWLMASIRTLGETTPLPAVQLAGLALGVAAAGVATLLPAHAWFAWRERWWTRGGRVAYTLVAIAGLAFSTWLSEWKLLGFHY
jgi:hypothetical protein